MYIVTSFDTEKILPVYCKLLLVLKEKNQSHTCGKRKKLRILKTTLANTYILDQNDIILNHVYSWGVPSKYAEININ